MGALKRKTKSIIKLDNYDIPLVIPTNKDKKVFNIFFHMLKREPDDKNMRKKCQRFLELVFNVKNISSICI